MLSLKNISALVDISSDTISYASDGGTLVIIKLCVKTAIVLRDCYLELKFVSNEEREGMLKKVGFLQQNLREIEHTIRQKKQKVESEKKEITVLHSELQKVADLLKDMDEEAKRAWYDFKRIWKYLSSSEKSMTTKFNAMKITMENAVQKSTLIVSTLNMKLIASLKNEVSEGRKKIISELRTLRLQHNTLHILFVLHNDGIDDLVTDESVSPPDPPNLHITESEGKLFVKWEAQSDEIDLYRLCYDEEQNLIMKCQGNKATIGPPKFDLVPGKIYTMKVCGINSGGRGEWSNSVVQQFTKPCPSKPEPPKVCSISASKAKIILTTPKLACPTESPVTEWEVEYAMLNQIRKEWKLLYIVKIERPGIKKSVHIMDLIAKQTYWFRARAKNAEGWSSDSKTVKFEMVHHSYCTRNGLAKLIILLVVILVYIQIFITLELRIAQ